MTKEKLWLIAALLVAGTAGAWAQDGDVGQSNFKTSCASCHGADGKGNGPVGGQLKVPPSDLTVLAKKNNGVFPLSRVYEVIDGRQPLSAHGTREMPIWGFLFALEQPAQDYPARSLNPETVVRLRILSIIDYLNRIQER